MYSLNLISCLILLGLGSIYVLTKPLSVGNKIPSVDSNGIARHGEIYLDEIALALVQNIEESESSDEEGLIFTEPFIPADDSNNVNVPAGVPVTGNNGSNGSIIGSETKVNGPTSGTGNNNSKSGVVTSPDGNQTNIGQSTVQNDGTIVDNQGNTIAKVNPNGSVVDNSGNVVGKIDNDNNVVDNNGNTVATVGDNGSVTPVTPVAVPVVGSNGGNGAGAPTNNNNGSTPGNNSGAPGNNGSAPGNNGGVPGNNGNTPGNNGGAPGNTANDNSKSGIVTAPDGTSTNIADSTVDTNGNIVDPSGNTVGKINDNGTIVDSKGNPVGSIDNNGNVVDNNGNTVANVDSNTGKISSTPVSSNLNNPQDAANRGLNNKRGGELLYVLLPCFALLCGTGALAKKMLSNGDNTGNNKGENEPLTEMNNVGHAPDVEEPTEYAPVEYANTKANGIGPVAGAGPTTTTTTTTKTTTTYHSGAPKNMNVYQTNNIASTDLPAVETGPSMNSLIRDEFVNNNKTSNVMLPAVLGGAAAAASSASSSKTTKSYNTAPSVNTKKTTITTTTTTTKSSSSPKSTTTYKSAPLTPSDLETYDSSYNNKYANSTSSKSKYLFGAAPVAAGAYSSSKQSSKNKNATSYNNVPALAGNEEEEIIEEYIVEQGSKSPKFTTKNNIVTAAAAPQEIVEEEYIVEEGSRKPKKTIKKTTTTTTYRTIYKNGVPVQVPVSEEETTENKNLATGAAAAGAAVASSSKDAKADNPYMKMIPTVIETIVKHSIPMGDRSEEEKNNDLKKLMTMANVSLPEVLGGSSNSENRNTTTTTTTTTTTETRESTSSSSKNPKKTIKKTVYKTIYKNGLPVQVPVEEEEEVVKVMKSPKLKGINKRVTTYNINDKDAQEEPVIEEFSLSPKEASTEELPAEFKEYTEEFEVPSNKATKQKTIKKYVTVYKTVYKNGKPVEVVENIEIPEGKTPEEVIAALPKEAKVEKRSVKQTVIEKPVKESIIEERIVKPTVVKAPKVQSVKKYVTTYKTTYKNGVPVEETTETEDLPGQATETNSSRAENTTIEEAKSPKMKKIKKVTTYKTIYKNGKPVEVIEEVPEETVITAAPALVTTTKNVTEEDTEMTLGDKKTKTIITKGKKPTEETEEIYEEYIIEEGDDPKNLKRTVYRNGVPVTEDTDITIPIDGEQTEEMYEEYVIEDGKEKSVKKTFFRNGVEVPESEVSIRDVNARSSSSSPYMKLAPTIIENIVKYAIPGNKNDGEADLANLMSKVTEIATTVVPSTETKEVITTEPKTTSTGNVSTKEIITTKKGPVTTKQGPGSRYSSKTRTKIVDGKEVKETEEVFEEYIIEDGKEKVTKRTVLINGVEVPEGENNTRDVKASNPYMKLAPSIISYIVKYAVPGANNDSETDLADLMGQMTSITGLLGNNEKEGTEEEPNFPLRIPLEDKGIRSSESEVDQIVESREGLPSIIEEDENLPMENNRSTETTYETKKFEKNTLPKRSSSKRLSLELKAAVAKEIAKLESEINEETKNIPRPRKQSITNSKVLSRKESEQSIKAMAEGCLVRKPSNASSSAKSSSVLEEWSGPVFDKKVFEVVIEHIPQLPDEVKLNIGDLVEVKQVFEDGWAYGINTATKIDGTFPVNCLGEEREPNKNGRYVPRLIRVFQARDEAGKKDIEDEEKFKNELSEYAKKKKEFKLKKQQKKRK